MAKLTKDDMTKEALVTRFTNQLTQKDEKIKELERELILKDKRINELGREVVIYTTDENKTKKVLELKAQGHQYSVILDKMKFSSFEVNINEIRDICLNIESQSPELQLFYKKQVESFEEGIKINPELLKDTLTKRYEFLYNEASLDLIDKNLGVEDRRRIRLEMKDHLKELNNVLKNIVEDGKEQDKSIDILDDTMEEYRENSNKLVKLSINPNEIQTLKNIN